MTNDYILSSVTDVQQLLKGSANSQSVAMLNNVMAETIGMSMHNAVTAQHNAQMLNSATTTTTCARILSVMGAQPPAPPPPGNAPAPAATATPAVSVTTTVAQAPAAAPTGNNADATTSN